MNARNAAAVGFGLLIAFSVYRNGGGLLAIVGAGCMAAGLYLFARHWMSK